MKMYSLSPAGRRITLVLLAGALIILGFAIWTLRSTLAAMATDGPTVGQIVPALLMIVLIIATPLVIWNLLEEWSAVFTPTDDGLRFSALGVVLTYPWSGIIAIRPVDDDSDEPMHEILLDRDYTGQIGNPLLRLLHAQSYGRTKLPIYSGLADREALLDQIRRSAGIVEEPVAPVAPAESRT